MVTSPAHGRAVLQAILVVFLWATSWVLIKMGLGSIPALTFAGLRYALAFVVLLIVALRLRRLDQVRRLSHRTWALLALLGLLYYAATQGAIFVALDMLPAITTNLLLSFSAIVVALLGMIFLHERPQRAQWAGIGLYLGGVLLFFLPLQGAIGQGEGILAALLAVLFNAIAALLGRDVNRSGDLDPLTVTLVSMGIGSLLLLGAGVALQGLPRFDVQGWLIVGWLAVVNTAFAFTLWNHSLRTLSALESSLINNLMMIFIPLLAWLFLEENLNLRQGAGMLLAALGILIVQLWPSTPVETIESTGD